MSGDAAAPLAPRTPRPVLGDLTLVIPTLGRPVLRECLRAVAGGDAWPAALVVVDQGAGPEPERWTAALREAGLAVDHVHRPPLGIPRAVNLGISRARTRFVVRTDDDCLADPGWLGALAARLRETPGALVTGRVEAAGEEEPVAVSRSLVPAVHHRPGLRHDALSGGNMAAATDVLRRLGPFDEDLAAAEDCEYSYRALRAGVPIVYEPTAVVRHVGWRDVAARERQYDAYARGLAVFFGKYLRRGDTFIALRTAVHLLRAAKRWARGAASGNAELARNGRAYLRGLLPGLREGWRLGARRGPIPGPWWGRKTGGRRR